ncbi:cytosine permease [Kyrpidia spormannii]|uniref:Cytosine permease n=1 Tax=Kyrpidia spormannii TaxID=2055160 RepID=A0A2K8N7Q9_9BACL|nr:cytosine permease [Kyrpidia spormannii]ATY85135.1 cytosine permease [Kyrpidia spormannii]
MQELVNSNDYERQPVPKEERQAWYRLSAVWIAIGIDLSSVLLGVQIGNGLSFGHALAAVFVGSLILAAMSAASAYVGAATGLSTALLTRQIFGECGAKLISLILGVSLLGWFGVQAGFFAENAHAVNHSVFGLNWNVQWLAVIGGLLMMTSAIYGYRSIEKLSVVAVPLLVILIFLAIGLAGVRYGWAALHHPAIQPLSFGMAVSLVIGIFVVGAVIAPDIARWARTKTEAILAAFVGFLIGNSFMLVVAIILSKLTNTENLTQIFIGLGLGIPAIIVLTLAQWTTNTNNLYSSSLGFSVVFTKVPKRLIAMVAGILATGLAYFGIFDHFITFLSIITTLIAPIGGVYVGEYFFVDAERLQFRADIPHRWIGRSALSWAVGSLLAFATTPVPDGFGWFSLTTVPALDGFLAAAIVQVLVGLPERRRAAHPEETPNQADDAQQGQNPNPQQP